MNSRLWGVAPSPPQKEKSNANVATARLLVHDDIKASFKSGVEHLLKCSRSSQTLLDEFTSSTYDFAEYVGVVKDGIFGKPGCRWRCSFQG